MGSCGASDRRVRFIYFKCKTLCGKDCLLLGLQPRGKNMLIVVSILLLLPILTEPF